MSNKETQHPVTEVYTAVTSWITPDDSSRQWLSEIHLPRDLTLSPCDVRRRTERQREARAGDSCSDYQQTLISSAPTVDCQKLAKTFAFFIDDGALTGSESISRPLGELVWMRPEDCLNAGTVAARPALIVYTTSRISFTDRIEIVPNVASGDPILQHIELVLNAELEATTTESHLYAEALADALALHFVKRYRA
jgi:hypothetical protein